MSKRKFQRRRERCDRRPEVAAEPAVSSGAWRRQLALAGVVFLVAFAVFANSLANGFAYDDVGMIRDNERLESPWSVGTFFGTSYWGDFVDAARLYRPLTVMSFAVDRAIFGPGPFGVHLMNVLANALLAALVHLFVYSVLRQQDVAFVTALLFAIHPVHTEVVANGVGRAELYAGVFTLLAALFHLQYLRVKEGNRTVSDFGLPSSFERAKYGPRYLLTAVALYFVAMLFKESAAVLPGLLFLVEWLVLQRGKLQTMFARLERYAVYGVALFVALIMRLGVVEFAAPAQQEVMAGTTDLQRLIHASETLLRYLGQLVYPMELCAEYADYTAPIDPSLTDPMFLASLAVWLVGGVFVYWLARRQQHVVLLALGWFFLTILPVSNILVPIGSVRADRFLFMPSLGFALGVGWAAVHLARRTSWRLVAAGLAVVLVFYGWRSFTRNNDWQSQGTLWAATVRSNPGYAPGWVFVGDFHRENGDLADAAEAYRRAGELRDAAGFFYTEAHVKRAYVLGEAGFTEEAEQDYRLVLQNEPDHGVALMNLGILLMNDEAAMRDAAVQDEVIRLFRAVTRVMPEDPRGHQRLARALEMAGRVDEASASIDRTLELGSDDSELSVSARTDLGRALLNEGRVDEAVIQLTKAVELAPDSAETHANLGMGLITQGKYEEASARLAESIRLDPDIAATRFYLAIALEKQDRLDEAIDSYAQAVAIDGTLVDAYDNMAVLLARKGMSEDALPLLLRAVSIDPEHANAQAHLGIVLLSLGRAREAVGHLEEALRLSPGHPDAIRYHAHAVRRANAEGDGE